MSSQNNTFGEMSSATRSRRRSPWSCGSRWRSETIIPTWIQVNVLRSDSVARGRNREVGDSEVSLSVMFSLSGLEETVSVDHPSGL